MAFNKFIKIRIFFILMCLIASSNFVIAQDAATATADSASVTEQTSPETSLADASTEVLADADDDSSTTEAAVAPVDNTELYKSVSYYLILFFLLCVFFAIIGKVLKVYELTSEINGKASKINWHKVQGVLFAIILVLSLYGTYWSYKVWGGMSMNEAASEHGLKIDSMMNVTIIITTIVFVITQILLFGFAYKYSSNSKRKAYFYPHNNTIERLWTIIPAISLTILVLYGFTTWRSITNPSEEQVKSAINIEISGEQFKWNVRYAGANNEFGKQSYKAISPTNALGMDFTDPKNWDDRLGAQIVMPVNKPVRFTIRSKDVLHSFYMPDFRVQMNAVPGMPTYFQFTPRLTTEEMREKTGNTKFEYVLLCAKICGAGHYNMQYTVKVVSEQEYKDWLANQPLFFNDDVKKELNMAKENTVSTANQLASNNK